MTRSFGGFTLIDSATGDVVFVSTDVSSKRFKVEQPDHKLTAVESTTTGVITAAKAVGAQGMGAQQ